MRHQVYCMFCTWENDYGTSDMKRQCVLGEGPMDALKKACMCGVADQT